MVCMTSHGEFVMYKLKKKKRENFPKPNTHIPPLSCFSMYKISGKIQKTFCFDLCFQFIECVENFSIFFFYILNVSVSGNLLGGAARGVCRQYGHCF